MSASSKRGGLLPLARRLQEARRGAGVRRPAPSRGRRPETGPPEPRFFNSGLFREAPGGRLARLDPRRTLLRVGEIYHLGLQIGPHDEMVPVFGAAALLEEVFKWTPFKAREGEWALRLTSVVVPATRS